MQLAAYTSKSGNSSNILPDMRQAQLDGGLSLQNVWFATAADCGDPGSPWTDIHPRKKQPVGQRLSAVAAARLYGQSDVTSQGPLYGSSRVLAGSDPSKVQVQIDFTPGSLPGNAVVTVTPALGQACPPTYNYTAFCAAFVVAFSDGSEVEVQADAVAVAPGGKGIVITAPVPVHLQANADAAAAVPVSTRYAYAPWPVTSLYTSDGWPAVPWNRPIGA